MRFAIQILMLLTIGCSAVLSQTSETQSVQTVTVSTIPDDEVDEGSSQRVKDYNAIGNNEPQPTSLVGMPDFTDDGLSWLVSRAGRSNPSLITSCVVPSLTMFIVSTQNPDTTNMKFTAVTPLGDIESECQNNQQVVWNMTSNQKQAWKSTPGTVKNSLKEVVNLYQTSLASGGPWFPLVVKGLRYGGNQSEPYASTVLEKVLRADGSTYEWILTLMP